MGLCCEQSKRACSILRSFIQIKGLRVGGGRLHDGFINYFSEQNPDTYVIRIWVEVMIP